MFYRDLKLCFIAKALVFLLWRSGRAVRDRPSVKSGLTYTCLLNFKALALIFTVLIGDSKVSELLRLHGK